MFNHRKINSFNLPPRPDGGKKSFNLLELMVTIAIAAALIVGAMFFVANYATWSRLSSDKQTYTVLNDALTRYKTQGGGVAGLTYDATISRVLANMQSQVVWAGMSHQFLESAVTYRGKSIGETGTGAQYHFSRYNSYSDGSGDGSGGNGGGVTLGPVLVCDKTHHRIATFTTAGTFVSAFGASNISYPAGVAVDGSGNIYVADSGNNAVYKFSSSGTLSATIGSGTFAAATDIAVDSSGNIYVSDAFNACVFEFSPSGTLSATIGSGTLSLPYGVAVGGGSIYVSDVGNGCVSVFNASGTNTGNYTGGGAILNPAQLCLDGSGNIYVADEGSNKIVVLTSAGGFSSYIGAGHFTTTYGVAYSAGILYATDYGAGDVLKFSGGTYQGSMGSGTIGSPTGICVQ